MSIVLVEDDIGSYYKSSEGTSEPLNTVQMQANAKYIRTYLTSSGWSLNAISAMLGNMQAESTMNPSRWQNDDVGNTSLGYGLVQWTPSTKYTDFCESLGLDPSSMLSALIRIEYEAVSEIQWIPTTLYDFSFTYFKTSTMSTEDLAIAFLLNYERPADQSSEVQQYRSQLAKTWYDYLNGIPIEPPNSNKKQTKRKYKFLIFNARRRKEQWIK